MVLVFASVLPLLPSAPIAQTFFLVVVDVVVVVEVEAGLFSPSPRRSIPIDSLTVLEKEKEKREQ